VFWFGSNVRKINYLWVIAPNTSLVLPFKNCLDRLVKTAGKISGSQQAGTMSIYTRQVLRKANAILHCSNHPLLNKFELLPSGRRFRAPIRRTKRLQVSFIPTAIYLLNGK